MTTQNIDITKLLVGMSVANREKAEIKLLLQFIAPYCERFAVESSFRRGSKQADCTDEPISVEEDGQSLVLITRTICKKDSVDISYRLVFRATGANDYALMAGVRGCRKDDRLIGAEGLGIAQSGICRNVLMPRFIDELCNKGGWTWFQSHVLDEYYEAATRG